MNRLGAQEVSAAIDQYIQQNDTTAGSYCPTPPPPAPTTEPASETDLPGRAPSTLREFIVHALAENRDIKAAEEMAWAKAERIPQVTALPDPMVSTITRPLPVQTADGDNYFVLGIEQSFPIPEKLDRRGRMALEETRMALDQLQETRLRVIADVKRAYFQLYVIEKSIDVTDSNQSLLGGLIDVARSQVAAGRRPQDDVLRAQVELSSLEAELIQLRRERITVAARLNELLNRPPGIQVPSPPEFSIRQADLSLGALLAKAAEANPELLRFERQVQREQQALALARLEYWPDFTLGFEWMQMEPRDPFVPPRDPMTGQRPAYSRMSEEGGDVYGIMFGFSLPIWFEKIEAGVREAQHNLSSTQLQYESARNRVSYQVAEALERVHAQRELADLFDTTIIPQARQTFEISQVSYTAGTSDFLYVVDNWRKWLAFAIQYYRSLGELERSVADLEQAIGLSLSQVQP